MRKILFITFLFTASVFACPELSGKYRCESEHNSNIRIVIEQNNSSYKVNDELYHADNLPYIVKFTEPATGVKVEITTTSHCEGESLKSFRTFSFDGEVLGTYDVHIRKEAGLLHVTNVFKGQNEVRDEIICR